MEHPLSGKMLGDRERFREKTQSQDGMGRRSARKAQILIAESSRKAREDVSMFCIFIEFSKISLSSFQCAQSCSNWQRGRKQSV